VQEKHACGVTGLASKPAVRHTGMRIIKDNVDGPRSSEETRYLVLGRRAAPISPTDQCCCARPRSSRRCATSQHDWSPSPAHWLMLVSTSRISKHASRRHPQASKFRREVDRCSTYAHVRSDCQPQRLVMSSPSDAWAPKAHQLPDHRAHRGHVLRAPGAVGHADLLAVSNGHVHHRVGHRKQPRQRRRDVDLPVAWRDARGVELRVCVVMVVVALRVPLVPPNIVLPPFARLFFPFFSSCLVFALVFEC
jgi:hypothetical protein